MAEEAVNQIMKHCKRCLIDKPINEMYVKLGKPIGVCRDCKLAAKLKYRQANRAAIAAKQRKYKAKNYEKIMEYRRNNKELAANAFARWQLANREHRLEYGKAYREANPAKRKASYAAWRAAKKHNGGSYTQQDIENLMLWQNGECYYCDDELLDYHVDHYIPLSKGGKNENTNLVLACPLCNLRKNARMPEDWQGPFAYIWR